MACCTSRERGQVVLNIADRRMCSILQACPLHADPYIPTWWCSGLWTNVGVFMLKEKFSDGSVPLRRDTIMRPDGGEVSVDWANDEVTQQLPVNAPVLGILHTITGHSSAQAGFMKYAASRGWRSCVLNRRGHSGMPLRVPSFSLLGNVDDTVAMVDCICETHPSSFIALAGISAGSGQVVSYIGREGNKVLVGAAASLCPSWDITKSFTYLNQRYPSMDRYVTRKVQEFFLKSPQNQAALASMSPAVEASLKATTLQEFVHAAAPLAGCRDVEQYFRENNPMEFFAGSTTPCLVMNALDDFLCVEENIRKDLLEEGAMNYVGVITEHGSHCAYTEGASGEGNYMWRKTLDFFDAVRANREAGSEIQS